MSETLKITIAGGGVAGLAAAACFAGQGHSVRVAERAPAFTEVGAGIQISPNGGKVLHALGLGEALEHVGTRIERVRLIDGPSGRDVTTLEVAKHRPDMPFFAVHRAELISFLLDGALAAGATLENDHELAAPPEGRALAGEDLLVGADGLKSVVRARVDDASKPFFTRQVAWRAIIDDDVTSPEVQVHMGPGRHLVTYPLIGNRRNLVAVEERTSWAEEGWSHTDHPANLRGAFAGFAKPVQDWLARVEHTFLWGLFRHPVAHRWHSGRQVLIGDAAHPTLPFLAQGANMALEDAWVLADMVNRHGVDDGLPRYQAARRDRVSAIVDAASKNARNYHLSFPPARFIGHNVLRAVGSFAPEKLLSRFDWIYQHDVTA